MCGPTGSWMTSERLAAAVKAGGVIAHPPTKIPGHGTFAIYIQGGINHGLLATEDACWFVTKRTRNAHLA